MAWLREIWRESLTHHPQLPSVSGDTELVYFDTTSISFEGEGGETRGQHGPSKDRRPDLKQMAAGMILDGEGRPVCGEMWPGNTTDVKTLIPVVDRLKKRFVIVRVSVVADRGLVSRKTLEALQERGLEYILDARMRTQSGVTETVLARAGHCHEVTPERRRKGDPSPLKVKQVWVAADDGERRDVIYRNEEEARKDARGREAIVASLREALRRCEKCLAGNRRYRRHPGPAHEQQTFDDRIGAVVQAALADGGEVPVDEAAPLDATEPAQVRRGDPRPRLLHASHARAAKGLEDRLEAAGIDEESARVLADLDRLTRVDAEKDGKRFRVLSTTSCCAGREKSMRCRRGATDPRHPAGDRRTRLRGAMRKRGRGRQTAAVPAASARHRRLPRFGDSQPHASNGAPAPETAPGSDVREGSGRAPAAGRRCVR